MNKKVAIILLVFMLLDLGFAFAHAGHGINPSLPVHYVLFHGLWIALAICMLFYWIRSIIISRRV